MTKRPTSERHQHPTRPGDPMTLRNTTTCTDQPTFVAECPVCDLFELPTDPATHRTREAAEQAAGEHDDTHHHGEPTATVHHRR